MNPEYLIRRLLKIKHPEWSDPQLDHQTARLAKECPGYFVRRADHTGGKGANSGCFHSILQTKRENGGAGLWPGNATTDPYYSPEEIVAGIKRAYELWGEPEVGRIAEAWFRSKELIP